MGTLMLVLAAAEVADDTQGLLSLAKDTGAVGAVLILVCVVIYGGYIKMYRPEVQASRENQKELTTFAMAMKDAMASQERMMTTLKETVETSERNSNKQDEHIERLEVLTRKMISVTGSTGDSIDQDQSSTTPVRPRRTG